MGSGDLNLKKSWHVGRAANISATAKAEAEAIAERKKTAARLAEIREERKKEEIQKQLAAAGSRTVVDRVEWMYTGGPGDGTNGDSAASEAFLLGKRTLDRLLVNQDNEMKQLQKQASLDSTLSAQTVNTVRDTATKIREDPLLAIKKQEQQAYEAMMNDPIKRRQLLASMGIDESANKAKAKEERRHKRVHRHHHRRHHEDREDVEERSSRRRRRSESRHRSRSRRRYSSEDEGRHGRTRRGSTGQKRSRSRNGRRSRSRSKDGRRYRETRDERDDRRRDRNRSSSSTRSRSPPRRRRDDSGDRRNGHRPGPAHREDMRNGTSNGNDRGGRDYSAQDRPQRYNNSNGNGGSSGARSSGNNTNGGSAADERARKLAAMQSAASDLDLDRERRLAELDSADKADREADERARRSGGGEGRFVSGLHRQAAGGMDLAARIGRGRRGLVNDAD